MLSVLFRQRFDRLAYIYYESSSFEGRLTRPASNYRKSFLVDFPKAYELFHEKYKKFFLPKFPENISKLSN